MKLPNVDAALVSREKIVDYLLSSTHRDGRHKAAFFLRFGFRPEAWEKLATALVDHARDHEVAEEEASPFGTRYVVHGRIRMPNGRQTWIRTVWFIESGETVARLVTAYPIRGNDDD